MTGARRPGSDTGAARSLQFDRQLVVDFRSRGPMKWVGGRIAGKAMDRNFRAAIPFDCPIVVDGAWLALFSILSVEYSVLDSGCELEVIGWPVRRLSFADFFDNPNSVKWIGGRFRSF